MEESYFTGNFDKDFYDENGYWLYKRPVFKESQFINLKQIYEELQQEADSNTNSKSVAAGRHNLDTPHFYKPELLDFLLSDVVLDLVEPIIGPNICLWSSHFISKKPKIGKKTPWHEDSAYWKGRFDKYDKIVTIWLAIDSSTKENGALQVVPGTHLNGGFSDYIETDKEKNVFATEINNIDISNAVIFELQPNECSMHDGRIIHGADANTSDTRRCGYTMRYFSQDLKLNSNHPMNKDFKIWHARGKNVHNNPVQN